MVKEEDSPLPSHPMEDDAAREANPTIDINIGIPTTADDAKAGCPGNSQQAFEWANLDERVRQHEGNIDGRFALSWANRFVDPQVETAYNNSAWVEHQGFGVLCLTCLYCMVLLLRVATVKDYIHFGTLQQFKLEFWFTIISTLSFLVLLLVWRWYGLQRTGPHLGAIVLIALLYSMAFVLQLGLTHHDAKCWTEWVMGPDNTSGITWELNSELAHQVHPYIGRINQDLGAMVAAVPIIAILVFSGISLPMPMSVPTIWLITITQIAVYITGPYDIRYFLVVPVTIGIGVGASVLAIVYDHQRKQHWACRVAFMQSLHERHAAELATLAEVTDLQRQKAELVAEEVLASLAAEKHASELQEMQAQVEMARLGKLAAEHAGREQEMRTQLRESELAQLKLTLQQCVMPSMPGSRSADLVEVFPEVKIQAMQTAAWSAEREWVLASDSTPSHGLCMAAVQVEGDRFKGFLLKEGKLGREMRIKEGSHAFIKASFEENFLRISLKAAEFGDACGHPSLANEMPVLYAGEVEFDDTGRLLRWNNMSGTYRCSDKMAYQTGLPLQTLWAICSEIDGPNSVAPAEQTGSTFLHTSSGIPLRRALHTSEKDFEDAQAKWKHALRGLISEHAEIQACHQKLNTMIEQRVQAVENYGYKCVAI